MRVNDFIKGQSVSMVTCYDYTFAKVINESKIDCVLVGDSVAMVVYGEDSTTHASVKMIKRHVQAVRKGYKGFVIADLPFLSLQKSITDLLEDVKTLINAGANAIKIEGVTGNEENIKKIIGAGVPVVGHVGLTPQFVNSFGGFKVQGRDLEQQEFILSESKKFEELGSFMLVVECVPVDLSKKIVNSLEIPTVGIGAGSVTDGQVLVLHDLLGLTEKKYKFVKKYQDFFDDGVKAISNFTKEIKDKSFPDEEHTFL